MALVTFQIVLRGVVIVQDVAIELQRVERFNYLQLLEAIKIAPTVGRLCIILVT